MWPQYKFESNDRFVPEFDNPPGWEGVITLFGILILFLVFRAFARRKLNPDERPIPHLWLTVLILIVIAGVLNHDWINASVLLVLIAVIQSVRLVFKIAISEVPRRTKSGMIITAILFIPALLLAIVIHV